MTLGEINNYARFLLNESDNQGRFSDAQMAMGITQATRDVALEVRFPEYQLITTTPSTPTAQEYILPDIINIKRVYLNGMLLTPSSIPTLEGDQILMYDATGTNYVPQWKIASVATYPVSSDCGFPAAISSPYTLGSRPSYYLRGESVIGIVPPPAGGSLLQLEGIAFPAPYVNMTDITIYSRHYCETLAQGAVKRCMQSDKDVEGVKLADALLKEATGKLMDWLNSFLPVKPVVPVTYRTMYRGGSEGYSYQGRRGAW
jgi:hypothetical protein